MDFVHGCEREGLSNYQHELNVERTDALLAALHLHHGNGSRLAPRAERARAQRFEPAAPVPVAERLPGPPFVKLMPPIEDEVIAVAHEIITRRPPLSHVEAVQRAVLRAYPTVSLASLKSAERTAPVVMPRQIAMYLARRVSGRSFPEIGRRFGGRDHTTVLHAYRKIETKIAADKEFAAHVSSIESDIEEIRYDFQHPKAEDPDRQQGTGVEGSEPEHQEQGLG